MYKLYMQVFWYFGGKQQASFYDSTPEVFCLESTFLSGSPCHIGIHDHYLNSIRNKTWGQYSINNFSYANIAAPIVLSP